MNERIKYSQRLDDLFSKVPRDLDAELLSHWAKYLCVLTCGYLEISVPEIFRQYKGSQASPQVVRFVEKRLSRFLTPKHSKVAELISCFDDSWSQAFAEDTAGEVKDHVDSLVANRNQIAHGQSSGVTVNQVSQWYVSAKKMIAYLEDMCSLGISNP